MAPQDGRRIRRYHRPGAPHRLVRRGHCQVCDPGQRHHRLLPDQARRVVRPGQGAHLRGLRRGRDQAYRDPHDTDRVPPCHARVRVPGRLVGEPDGSQGVRRSSTPCQGLRQSDRGHDRRAGVRDRHRPAPRPDPPAPPAHLTPAHLTPAHLTPAHLTPAHLPPAHLTPAHLTPAHLPPAHLTPAHLTPAHLTPAHLTPAHLTPAHL